MRKVVGRIGLTLLGVPLLSGGWLPISPRSQAGTSAWQDRVASDPRMPHVTAAQRQVWLDSLVQEWPDGIIPIRESHEDAPLAEIGRIGAKEATAANSAWLDCPPMFEMEVTSYALGHYFDKQAGVTQVFARTGDETARQVMKYEIDSALSYTSVLIAADSGGVWLAEDLDQDGDVELVMQFGDELKVFSAPEWELRSRFIFPGMAVVMYPVAVNIDEDPYLEIYVTPNTWGEDGMPTIIKYDEPSDSFKIIFQMWAPDGAIGQPAVGDFDEDGRVEFISGNNLRGGYGLFEWQDPALVYIGSVVDSLGKCTNAVACRPLPGGTLHVCLSGGFGDQPGSRYLLYEPTGDNTFSLVHTFADPDFYSQIHPSWATDTDCDGLDELVMYLRPTYSVWEWDNVLEEYVEGCAWDDATYGSLINWYALDLDQDGRPEFTAANTLCTLYSFPGQGCLYCDSSGLCLTLNACACACTHDPVCDGVTDVLDVVSAVDVAFRGGAPRTDPFWQCPRRRTDVNCDDLTNVLDVVHLVNVAFRSGDAATEFCNPCS